MKFLQMGNTGKYNGGNTRIVIYVPFVSFITEKFKYSSFSPCLLLIASGMSMTLGLECRRGQLICWRYRYASLNDGDKL